MKKILIPILILFLTACTATGAPKDAKEDKRELISNQKIQECLKLSFKIQREECYLEYVMDKVYSEEVNDVTLGDVSICDYIEESSRNNAECNWLFAMKLREEDICDKITYEPVIDDDYLSKEICHQSLSYNFGNTKWTLEKGIPPSADPDNFEYFGGTEIKGWIVLEPTYVGDPVKQFKVHPDDIINLPPAFRHRDVFQLKDYSLKERYRPISEGIMAELSMYSEQNPATISIQTIYALMEGTPFIGLKEIITE